ncbi:MAG: hypothetical protein R6V73_12335 [Anaerolineales bacterium]|jgi:hypothetical protein
MLLWLPVEDTNEKWPLVFAATVNAWTGTHHLVRLSPAKQNSLSRHLLVGAVAGVAVTPIAIFLMAFKTGMHGHGTPDFTAEQILSVIHRTPIWGIAGLFLGLVTSFIFRMKSK